jgi:hypothetical protein
MWFKFTAFIAVVLFLTVSSGIAQTQAVEKVTVPKNMLTTDQIKALETQELQSKIETYGKWVGIGNEVGKAVDGSLKAITSNAVDLSKTGLGKYTMFLVAWKVMGTSVIQLFIGLLFGMVFVPLFVWSYWRMCIPRRVLVQDSADKKTQDWEVINKTDDDETNGVRWMHFVTFIIWIIVEAIVIFA